MVFSIVLLAVLVGLVLSKPAIWISRQWNLIDDPETGAHKIHHFPVQKAGGLILFLSLICCLILTSTGRDNEVRTIVGAMTIVFIFGLWDDRKGLSAPWKFLGQFLAVSWLIGGGIQVNITGSLLLNIFLTVVWVLGITNAFNLVDSKDGLALGLAIIAASLFTIVMNNAGQFSLAQFSTILMGACFSVYYFNAAPAKLFLGDSGSQLIGVLLASLSIVYTPPGLPQASSWFVPIMLLGVPIFDTSLVTISRLRRGLPVFQGRRDHTYHRLVSLGFEPARAVLTMHLCAGLLSCVAFIALEMPPLLANLIFAASLIIGIISLLYLEYQQDSRTGDLRY